MCKDSSGYSYPQSGKLNNLNISPNGKNNIELSTYGSKGHFTVNSELISILDLSCAPEPGDVSLVVGWLVSAYDGNQTRFKDFTVGKDPNKIDQTEDNNNQADSDPVICDDNDEDLICDEQEQAISATFIPRFYFDEEEHNILVDQNPKEFDQLQGVIYLHQVSIVDCNYLTNSKSGENTQTYSEDKYPFGSGFATPVSILLSVLEIFPYYYLPFDPVYWNEGDKFVHYGDIEPIRICLRDDDRDGIYKLNYIHIRRHKHDYVYMPDEIKFTNQHAMIYVSEGKHGTYFSTDECEDAVSVGQWRAWDEDCGGGKKIKPYTGLEFNVGEGYKTKSVTLMDIGLGGYFKMVANTIGSKYINEYIWTTKHNEPSNRQNTFCGGVDVADYAGNHKVITKYTDNNCAHGMQDKWWPYFVEHMNQNQD